MSAFTLRIICCFVRRKTFVCLLQSTRTVVSFIWWTSLAAMTLTTLRHGGQCFAELSRNVVNYRRANDSSSFTSIKTRFKVLQCAEKTQSVVCRRHVRVSLRRNGRTNERNERTSLQGDAKGWWYLGKNIRAKHSWQASQRPVTNRRRLGLSARRNFSPVSQRRRTRRNIWNNVDLIIRACG